MTTNTGTILVVDDDALNRILLSTNLEEAGYTVAVAEDGQQALEMLQAQPFEIVLLDLLMPKMDGFEVLAHMKADDTLQHIPVIVVSASDEMESVVRCIEMGATDYLPKPFDPVLLHARVNASLAAKRLHDQEQTYLEAIKREMELGRQIQADFLPLHLPQPDGWEIAISFNPAREVAGDFYDAFTLSDRCVGLIIADVCGKGVGAALFMALIRSLLRSFAEQATLSSAKSACESDVLKAIPLTNDYITLHHQRRKRMFATLFFGVLNTTTGTMTYINAGHHPPIIIGANGIQEFPMPTAPALGLFPDIEFTPQQAHFALGDILLTYTDGVIEAFNPNGELFSEKRLMDSLQQNTPTASALLKRVETSVQAHVAGSTPSDDITMLAVRRASTN
jgi:serine phosphatase RsbU (regulator of sigma subunit)